MLIKVLVFLLALLYIYGCCSTKAVTSVQKTNQEYKKVAEEKFGDNHNIIFNSDSSYLIAYTHLKKKKELLESPLKYFIYSMKEDKVIFEDNLANGEIEWIDDYLIKVSTTPEIVKENEDLNSFLYGYIYNVKLNKKINKPDQKSINN